jgi:hypothetical protein
MIDPTTSELGINITHLAAGFSGGMVRCLVGPRTGWWKMLSTSLVGALSAGYLTPLAILYLPIAMQ